MPRLLGIDYGTRRIGLALSDETGIIAMPLGTVVVGNPEKAVLAIKATCVEKQVAWIVLGLPLNMDGTSGFAVKGVTEFADTLRAATGLRVEMWDERLSTAMVERMLVQADTRREKRKNVRDQLAAQVILQGYLDRTNNANPA
ncbi:MAG: Holliday junction resolvase RuvX [bacterium]